RRRAAGPVRDARARRHHGLGRRMATKGEAVNAEVGGRAMYHSKERCGRARTLSPRRGAGPNLAPVIHEPTVVRGGMRYSAIRGSIERRNLGNASVLDRRGIGP